MTPPITSTPTRRLAATLAVGALLAGGLLGATPAQAATVLGTATAKATIRSAAKSGATALGSLERGQHIPTTARAAGGWVKVRFHKGTGYVAAGQLTTAATNLPPAPTRLDAKTAKVATAGLNVRVGPRISAAAVGRIAEGNEVSPTGKLSGGYAEVNHAATRRWVSVRYLASLAPKAAVGPAPGPSRAGETALAFARRQLGKPYTYGATGPGAYDCSGLTLASWQAAGVTLPRTSSQQFGAGKPVAKADLRPGDLVFFYGPRPTHVALYVGDGVILHAPRPGRTVEYSKLAYMPFSGARRPA